MDWQYCQDRRSPPASNSKCYNSKTNWKQNHQFNICKHNHCAVPKIHQKVLSTCFPANTEAVLNNRLCAVFRTPFYKTTKIQFTQLLYNGLWYDRIFNDDTTVNYLRYSAPNRNTEYYDEHVCVCPWADLRNYMSNLHQIFCTNHPWPWPGLLLAAFRNIAYLWFYAHNGTYENMSIMLQRVTLLHHCMQAPAASYWLCHVLHDGGCRD